MSERLQDQVDMAYGALALRVSATANGSSAEDIAKKNRRLQSTGIDLEETVSLIRGKMPIGAEIELMLRTDTIAHQYSADRHEWVHLAAKIDTLTRDQKNDVSVESMIDSEMVKPEGLENTPVDQVAKLGFVEAMTAYTFAKLVKVRTFEDKDEQRTLVTVSDAKDEMGRVRDNMLGLLTRASKSGNTKTLEKNYKLNLDGVDLKLLRSYAGDFLTNPRDEGNSIFCMDPKVLAKINEEIESAKSDSEKEKLLRVKKALGGITQAVYSEIDRRIDDTTLGEVEQIMRKQLNFVDFTHDIPSQLRQRTLVGLNGHNRSGKGTTLGHLRTSAVETGTEGIAGRGNGFEQYELVMGPYDLARVTGEMIPSKVMRLLFATEMMAARQKLDQDGRVDEPVYVSGFPRDESQASVFKGVENMKSVALTITKETAVVRTLTAIAMDLDSKGAPREDDLSDLAFVTDDNNRLTQDRKDMLIDATRKQLATYKSKNEPGPIIPQNLAKQLEGKEGISICYAMYKAPKGSNESDSRYYKYDGTIKKIDKVMQGFGIETQYIKCDGKTPEAVTAEVRQAIGI